MIEQLSLLLEYCLAVSASVVLHTTSMPPIASPAVVCARYNEALTRWSHFPVPNVASTMRISRLDAGRDLWAMLLHGFTRNGRHLEPLAQALFAVGIGTVRPDLGSFNWFRSVNNAGYLDRVADDIAATLTGPNVVIGHSAGGAAGAYLATRLRMVQGIVFVDANESPTHLIERVWPKLEKVSKVAICAPASRCNRHGAFARWAREHGVAGCIVDGMGHGDIEGDEQTMYRIVCGDASSPSTRALVQDLVIASTMRMLNIPETSDPWGAPAVHPW